MFMSGIAFIKCQMKPFVVGGDKLDIKYLPHSVFLLIKCSKQTTSWICGGSIVNENIILTAAHCVYGCTLGSIIVSVGHSNREKGNRSTVSSYFTHEEYNTGSLSNDIALMKLKTSLTFGETVKRVALMQDPPYYEEALVGGWGLTDVSTFCLHY